MYKKSKNLYIKEYICIEKSIIYTYVGMEIN